MLIHVYDVDINIGIHAYVCAYDNFHGLVEKLYSRVKIMLEILILHPTNGASIDKPFQISLPSRDHKEICKVATCRKIALPNTRMEFRNWTIQIKGFLLDL